MKYISKFTNIHDKIHKYECGILGNISNSKQLVNSFRMLICISVHQNIAYAFSLTNREYNPANERVEN